MRLSRTHLVPVLAIVAGGVIGASLSFGLLGPSPAVDVTAPNPVVAPSATAETPEAPQLEEQRYRYVVRMQDIEALRRLERDHEERFEEAVESLRDRVEEIRGRLERDRMERYENARIF